MVRRGGEVVRTRTAALGIAILVIGSLGGSCPGSSTQYYGGAPDFVEHVTSLHHLFIARIDAVREIRYVPYGPCAEGKGAGMVTEVELRPLEILYGAGIGGVEVVRHFRNRDDTYLVPGETVLVWTNRTCQDAWTRWGRMAIFDSTGKVQSTPELRDFLKGTSPDLDDVRRHVRRVESRLPITPFMAPAGFDLVVTEGRAPRGDADTAIYYCRRIAHFGGTVSESPTALQFRYPSRMHSTSVHVGDTLLVPFSPGNQGPLRTFETNTEYFRVESGYLPALGIELDHFLDRYSRHEGGFELRSRREELDR